MGVDVDWRDVKELMPASATISKFTGTLVKVPAKLVAESRPSARSVANSGAQQDLAKLVFCSRLPGRRRN